MTVTRIIAHAEAGAHQAGEAALVLAAALGARLEAVVFAAEVMTAGPEPDEAAALRGLEARAAALGVPCAAHGRRSLAEGIGGELSARLRVSDLGVLDWPAPVSPARRMMAAAMIFGSGRPVVLAPPGTLRAMPQRVVVGWDGSPAAVRAMHAAMPLLRHAGEVVVATAAGPGDDEADPEGAAALLRDHGVAAHAAAMRRDGRPVLQALGGAGLLVAGAARHAPVHDLLFGSLTHDVLAGQAGMPVLLMA